MVTNSATVKPMAATQPKTHRSRGRMPAGRPKPKVRAASMPIRKMPTGLPMTRPPSTIQVGSASAENTTPAFSKPKKNSIPSTKYFSRCSIQFRRSVRWVSASVKMP